MFGLRNGADREQTDQGPPTGASTTPSDAPQPGVGQPVGSIPATAVNPYADPGVPELEVEDSTVDFHAAFEAVIEVKASRRIPDPLAGLDEKERAVYRDELQDVIDAQRYGRSLGSLSRRR